MTQFRTPSMRATLTAAAVSSFLIAVPAAGETLYESLADAYVTNPTLDAARAALLAVDEQIPQARAGRRPTIAAQGSVTGSWTQGLEGKPSEGESMEIGVVVTQPLWTGGRVEAALSRATSAVLLQRAQLVGVEQQVLLETATAYLDILRDEALVDLAETNLELLRQQLSAIRARFNVGEVTQTDVTLAQARLAQAQATLVQAQGNLRASRAAYSRFVETPLGEVEEPKLYVPLPGGPEQAVEAALVNNPNVVAAGYALEAAEAAVDAARADANPSASIQGSAGLGCQGGTSIGFAGRERIDCGDQVAFRAQATAQLTVPLYEGGAQRARASAAEHIVTQRLQELEAARRGASQTAVAAWEAFQAARASIDAFRAQAEAASLALEGVRQEAELGARTVIDVLNAEQDAIDARNNVITARRNELAAAFQLLAAMGRFTAASLELPVEQYDVEAYGRTLGSTAWSDRLFPWVK